jgi:hypothetical protein
MSHSSGGHADAAQGDAWPDDLDALVAAPDHHTFVSGPRLSMGRHAVGSELERFVRGRSSPPLLASQQTNQ